ncbi:hypothetical protein GCM10011511_29090 [Puia dinghuensis]|uniref:Uncharacterized protein n=1 Tax=Puia dinghuensis TaxID=1792502 RepID=A0A8J2UDU1_9BACT|nr:hypothetical protein GCM10011511_29090 [Puia dinghuensis]
MKLPAREAGGMDADPPLALFDKLAKGVLLGVRHIEWGEVQHDKDLVTGKIGRVDPAGVVGEIQFEVFVGGHLFKKGPGGGNHFQVIAGPGSHYQDTKRLRTHASLT